MISVLLQFFYLQILDLLSTLAFLMGGVEEGNPLVKWAMAATGSPVGGLALIKAAAVALGLFCFWTQRKKLLTRINWLYAGVVVWNLVAIVANMTQHAV